jgi:hypothetical protein
MWPFNQPSTTTAHTTVQTAANPTARATARHLSNQEQLQTPQHVRQHGNYQIKNSPIGESCSRGGLDHPQTKRKKRIETGANSGAKK